MPDELATYLFLHRELAKALEIVYSDYLDDYRFIPPNSYITERFERLMETYLKLESHKKYFELIDHLPLVKLRMFRRLSEQFDKNIRIWRMGRKSLDEDFKYIEERLKSDYQIPDKLKVEVYELREALQDYKKDKDSFLNGDNGDRGISINTDKASLSIFGKEYDIDVLSKPILFLKILLENQGKVVEYKDIGKYLDINSYHENVGNEDIKREIQEIKKDLINKLIALRVKQDAIDKLNLAIKGVRKKGYKLSTISL